jgi:hypothetical protein
MKLTIEPASPTASETLLPTAMVDIPSSSNKVTVVTAVSNKLAIVCSCLLYCWIKPLTRNIPYNVLAGWLLSSSAAAIIPAPAARLLSTSTHAKPGVRPAATQEKL